MIEHILWYFLPSKINETRNSRSNVIFVQTSPNTIYIEDSYRNTFLSLYLSGNETIQVMFINKFTHINVAQSSFAETFTANFFSQTTVTHI